MRTDIAVFCTCGGQITCQGPKGPRLGDLYMSAEPCMSGEPADSGPSPWGRKGHVPGHPRSTSEGDVGGSEGGLLVPGTGVLSEKTVALLQGSSQETGQRWLTG